MNYQELDFSEAKAKKRFNTAQKIFGEKVLKKIIMFSLFILGAKRIAISKFLQVPDEYAKTSLRILLRDGVSAFQDRRCRQPNLQKVSANSKKTNKLKISISTDKKFVVIDLGPGFCSLRIPVSHKIQVKTILLSFLKDNLLSTSEIAPVLNISNAHCRELVKKLENSDVDQALIDKRKGQKYDLLVSPEIKAEIIQQFAARSVAGYSTSSEVLAEIVNKTNEISLSPRTIRWHIKKLGLKNIKKSIPKLIDTLKKNS